ncbi:hypothetical protein [Desulfomonile tiedjei]|uniref:Uncharacterized protein n=1 Tax=Desulfomonile tiedjei (strain ATCC 49306 / DSM 6799 / DCB-1) TaxID=706587 RepID=I4C9U0_DESTA|nr:hypothetical protein [Desulfomonile tiedjei]AFM26331.1 hypothetical protein Desti_3686 [Desulfomonile tiedjei DSM 6799]
MRSTFLVATLCVALIMAFGGSAQAVGLYTVGKEDCNCSPLTANGIVPDTLNKMYLALLIPEISGVLDKVAIELKGMFDQIGKPPTVEAAVIGETPESKSTVTPEKSKEEKPAIEKKTDTKEKKSRLQSKADQKKKKKRVKVPSRVM